MPRAQVRREPTIALRISKLATGRTRVGRRVKYLVDPSSSDGERAIPERLVLRRWRPRTQERLRARRGVRLPPSTWRALGLILPQDQALWKELDEETIRGLLAEKKQLLRQRQLRAPPVILSSP
jgi:hypothetical protein